MFVCYAYKNYCLVIIDNLSRELFKTSSFIVFNIVVDLFFSICIVQFLTKFHKAFIRTFANCWFIQMKLTMVEWTTFFSYSQQSLSLYLMESYMRIEIFNLAPFWQFSTNLAILHQIWQFFFVNLPESKKLASSWWNFYKICKNSFNYWSNRKNAIYI